MSKIPPLDSLSKIVKAIVAFMPNIERAKDVVDTIQNSNKKTTINIKGKPTKQGRYLLEIEGDIPKDYAYEILKTIEDFKGDIEVVAGL